LCPVPAITRMTRLSSTAMILDFISILCDNRGMEVYTIGHSNHTVEDFTDLLRKHTIEVLVDVRSQPYSRRVPHFNREILARVLREQGFTYEHWGDRLGGRPADEGFLLADDSVDYDRVRSSEDFQQALDELLALARERRVALMCAEGDHRRCHRGQLITPGLLARDVTVLHIQPDGSLIDAASEPHQLSLF
jgi:uncharacterized protein (DUF488 family)